MELSIIQSKIYENRGCKVMIDRDLAEMYVVETRVTYHWSSFRQSWNSVVPVRGFLVFGAKFNFFIGMTVSASYRERSIS